MIDYKKYINALRKCAKEHENDNTFTGHIIVSDLCRDTANLLEELEQESFEDAISRQAVLDIAKSSRSNWIDNSVLFKRVNELPSVNPQKSSGDMVSREVFEQVKWERDVAIEQLKELGYGLGEKPKTIQEKQAESEKYEKAYDDGYKTGYAQARFDYEQEPVSLEQEPVIEPLERLAESASKTAKVLERFKVSEQEPILDKIRAEIAQLPTSYIEIHKEHSIVKRHVIEAEAVMRIIDQKINEVRNDR